LVATVVRESNWESQLAAIDDFFSGQRYVGVGIDATSYYGRTVVAKLGERGTEFVVIPADLDGETFDGLDAVEGELDGVLIEIEGDPAAVLAVMRAVVAREVPRVWIETKCEADEAVRFAREAGVEVVDNVCSLMALEPGGIHWLHRKLLDISGKTPTPA
jgi:predicted CoA-binding protein